MQYPDPAGQLHATYHLATYQGCGSNDPDHSYQGGRDSLAAAGVSHAYYFSDVPFTALWGARYAPISQPVAGFLAACAAGTLPAVSFVDPRFEDEGSGTSGDDHPHADIRVGQSFINEIYQAITSSPAWERTVFVINYDEWGGFFDHVAPATAPDASPANGLRGFRVPALVISPLARRGTVAHHTYDHASVLKMIEWRWGLPALTPRDAAARNIAEVLNFSGAPDLTAPRWNVPAVVPQACPATAAPAPAPAPTEHELTWAAVASLARASGFTLPLPGAPGLQCRDELLDFSYAAVIRRTRATTAAFMSCLGYLLDLPRRANTRLARRRPVAGPHGSPGHASRPARCTARRTQTVRERCWCPAGKITRPSTPA